MFHGSDRDQTSIFDPQSRRSKTLPGEASHGPYSMSPDGRIAQVVSNNGDAVPLYEIVAGQEITRLQGLQAPVAAVAWSPNGLLVATGEEGRMYGASFGDLKPQSVRIWDTATGKQRAIFTGFKSDVTALTLSPDGAFLVAGLREGTILVWDMAEAIPRAPVPKLTDVELEARWTDLLSDKAALAHEAIGTLVAASGQAVPFLRDRLRPTPIADPGKIQRWVADLDSDEFAVRESATQELTKIGSQIGPHVRKAMNGKVSAETARRLERILNAVDILDANAVRTIRAITILERIGSADARAVLETLAGGATGSIAAEEAAASLQRLARRR